MEEEEEEEEDLEEDETLHLPVLPVAEHCGLGLLPGDLPGQVGLVADDHQGQLLATLLVHQVPQPGDLLEGGEVADAVDEEHGVGGGEGAGEHGGELVDVAAAGVLDGQAEGGAQHLGHISPWTHSGTGNIGNSNICNFRTGNGISFLFLLSLRKYDLAFNNI